MIKVAVIDYGMGNLRSVAKAIEHVADKIRVDVTDNKTVIDAADRIVFPGQGAIGDAMKMIRQHGVLDMLPELIQQKPFLGICLGLQALMTHSDEDGGVDALNLIPGQVHHIDRLHKADPRAADYKIPHMGWNTVMQVQAHALWQGIEDGSRFYFVHSYYVQPDSDELITGVTDYGGEFASAMGRDNWFAVQFHPEKSQNAGLQLLKNFVEWDI